MNSANNEQLSLRFDIPLRLVSPTELYENAEAYLDVLKEDRRFERKSSRTSVRSLGEYFSMWANTVPDGGLIAVGIEDGGVILGCNSLSQKELNEKEQAGKVYCPDARYASKLVRVENSNGEDDFILLFKVDYRPDKVVYDSQGHAWTRIGDQKHELSARECQELQRDKGEVDYEQEAVLDIHYPDDFDLARISQFARSFRKSRSLLYEQNDEQIMALRHLGKMTGGTFIPNVACFLLFARAHLINA